MRPETEITWKQLEVRRPVTELTFIFEYNNKYLGDVALSQKNKF